MPAAEVIGSSWQERHVRIMLLVAGAVLSSLDAVFTLRFAGRFDELNPLLGGLLGTPLPFVAVKSALAVGALVTLACLSRSRPALVLLVGGVAFYAAVDGYWMWSAVRHAPVTAHLSTW